MNKHASFSRQLCAWYRAHARDLPWRRTRDPYKIWISEIMLQQTTVNAVIPYYQKWIKVFPTVASVEHASLQRVLRLWQGLGYYQRAKNIHKAANIICAAHEGTVPRRAEEMRRLPGFGPYTTGAVLSIAFGVRHPIIDANVRRVVMRLLAVEGHAVMRHDPDILKFLDQVMPHKNIGMFNQALMELGALVCRNRDPFCPRCPVRGHCRAYHKGKQDVIPAPRERVIKDIEVAVGILKKDGKYFIQKRPSKGLLADLWEFPGGKIEGKEDPAHALTREFKEELGIDVGSVKPFMRARHAYTQFRVYLHVFLCRSRVSPPEDTAHKWVRLPELLKYPMPSGSVRIVERLRGSGA
jgi:A/G-specific adenine glycosylase